MKKVTFSGTVEEYQGKPVTPSLTFSGEADQYENVGEVRGSEDWPNDNDILKMVNAKKLASAKSSAYQEVIKPLKEAYEKSDDFKRANLIKAALAAGFTQAEAEALAASKIG